MASPAQADSTPETQVGSKPSFGRFARSKDSDQTHEERGTGWRARWREGAERLALEREPNRRAKAARREQTR
jgi:hypothetical protein